MVYFHSFVFVNVAVLLEKIQIIMTFSDNISFHFFWGGGGCVYSFECFKFIPFFFSHKRINEINTSGEFGKDKNVGCQKWSVMMEIISSLSCLRKRQKWISKIRTIKETIADPTFALKYTTSINIHDGASAAAAAEVEGEILSINEASCTVFLFFF